MEIWTFTNWSKSKIANFPQDFFQPLFMEIVISQKVFVSGQKYSRIVLKTCVGPFGVNMNKI